jgi:hypothetical protein
MISAIITVRVLEARTVELAFAHGESIQDFSKQSYSVGMGVHSAVGGQMSAISVTS